MSLLPGWWVGGFRLYHVGRRADPAPRLDELDEEFFVDEDYGAGACETCFICGATLLDEDDFCPFCGDRTVFQAPITKKERDGKKW